jgi:hypothetical protein
VDHSDSFPGFCFLFVFQGVPLLLNLFKLFTHFSGLMSKKHFGVPDTTLPLSCYVLCLPQQHGKRSRTRAASCITQPPAAAAAAPARPRQQHCKHLPAPFNEMLLLKDCFSC